jgi:hypothetical protein
MSKVDKSEFEFAETIRPADVPKDGFNTTVVLEKLISTRYGDKRVLVIEDEKQVFLNAFSLSNLVKSFGDDTEKWQGKLIHIDVEKSKRTQDKASIVLTEAKPEKIKK